MITSTEFIRKVEDQVKIDRTFTELNELFKFLSDYLDAVSLGLLGVKIGQLGGKRNNKTLIKIKVRLKIYNFSIALFH